MIDDLTSRAIDTTGSFNRPAWRSERSRCDRPSPFDLLLMEGRETAVDSPLDVPDRQEPTADSAMDRDTAPRLSSRREAIEADNSDDADASDANATAVASAPPTVPPPATEKAKAAGSPGALGSPDSPGDVVAGGSDEDGATWAPQTPKEGAESFPIALPPANSGPGELPDGVLAAAGLPAPDQAIPADDAATVLAMVLASLPGETVNAITPAPTATAGAAAVHRSACSAQPGSTASTPAIGGSANAPGESGAAPRHELAAGSQVPFATALEHETSHDDQPSQQGQERGDMRALSPAAAASTTDVSPSTAVAGDKPPVSSRPLPHQVAIHIARGANDGLSRLTISLEPESLGRLDIRLELHRDGRLNARIVADRPETLNLLRGDANSLADSLNAAGIKASPDSLSFDLNSNNGRSAGQFAAPAQSARRFGSADEPCETVPPTPPWRAVTALGRVDIRA